MINSSGLLTDGGGGREGSREFRQKLPLSWKLFFYFFSHVSCRFNSKSKFCKELRFFNFNHNRLSGSSPCYAESTVEPYITFQPLPLSVVLKDTWARQVWMLLPHSYTAAAHSPVMWTSRCRGLSQSTVLYSLAPIDSRLDSLINHQERGGGGK